MHWVITNQPDRDEVTKDSEVPYDDELDDEENDWNGEGEWETTGPAAEGGDGDLLDETGNNYAEYLNEQVCISFRLEIRDH